MSKKRSDSENDINAILNQLKMAYSVDSTDESDDMLEPDTPYEDSELTSLLSKIISENSPELESGLSTDEFPETSKVFVADETSDDIAYEPIEVQPEETQSEEEQSEEEQAEEEQAEEKQAEEEQVIDEAFEELSDEVSDDDDAYEAEYDAETPADPELEDFEPEFEPEDSVPETEPDVEQEIEPVSEPEVEPEESLDAEINDTYIVMSREDYTDDPLQWHLISQDISEESEIPEKTAPTEQNCIEDIEDDDISILLQLGYKKELNTRVGSERTDSVIQNISNSYRPEKGRVPFGFCGKEFSESTQIDSIKSKYEYDKRSIIIKMAIFASVAVVLLLLGIIFRARTDMNSLIMFPAIELIVMLLGCAVIHKELWNTVIGIVRFRPTVFSLPMFSLAVLVAYDVYLMVMYAVSPSEINITTTPLFGLEVALLFLLALVAQLLRCICEQKTFDLISSADELYAGEILLQKNKNYTSYSDNGLHLHEVRKQVKGNAVIVRKTRYISEYFKRCSESQYNLPYTVLSLIFSLAAAVALACVLIFTEHGITDVVVSTVFTVFMCLSASAILVVPIIVFSSSRTLWKKGCSFVGTGAVDEYENTNSVVFPDTTAFELSGDVEVIPLDGVDINNAVRTSNRLFNSLGGTLHKAIGENEFDRDNSVGTADIDIAVIDENGIELYMDNETHIIFGNRKFILSYRKRLEFSANDFLSEERAVGREVIYLAINGKLSLAYTLSARVRSGFSDIVRELAKYRIRTFASTYEPHIKAVSSKDCKIGVYKPYDHESPERLIPRFGGAVCSGDGRNIAYALIAAKQIKCNAKISSKIALWLILVGFVLSLATTLVGYLVPAALPMLGYRALMAVAVQIVGVGITAINAIRLSAKNR